MLECVQDRQLVIPFLLSMDVVAMSLDPHYSPVSESKAFVLEDVLILWFICVLISFTFFHPVFVDLIHAEREEVCQDDA